jgi:hypothetical protein
MDTHYFFPFLRYGVDFQSGPRRLTPALPFGFDLRFGLPLDANPNIPDNPRTIN